MGAFQREYEHRAADHADVVDWFLTLPLWLDLPGLRVVHACWHAPFIEWLAPQLHDGRYLTRDLMVPATDEPPDEAEKDNATPSIFKAVECLTKGLEVPLPDGHSFRDKDGIERRRVRVRWWDSNATTYRTAAMMADKECDALPDVPTPAHVRLPASEKPVFFGHYWLTGTPRLENGRSVCLDYSAGKGGPLVGYRFDGEAELSAERLVWV